MGRQWPRRSVWWTRPADTGAGVLAACLHGGDRGPGHGLCQPWVGSLSRPVLGCICLFALFPATVLATGTLHCPSVLSSPLAPRHVPDETLQEAPVCGTGGAWGLCLRGGAAGAGPAAPCPEQPTAVLPGVGQVPACFSQDAPHRSRGPRLWYVLVERGGDCAFVGPLDLSHWPRDQRSRVMDGSVRRTLCPE